MPRARPRRNPWRVRDGRARPRRGVRRRYRAAPATAGARAPRARPRASAAAAGRRHRLLGAARASGAYRRHGRRIAAASRRHRSAPEAVRRRSAVERLRPPCASAAPCRAFGPPPRWLRLRGALGPGRTSRSGGPRRSAPRDHQPVGRARHRHVEQAAVFVLGRRTRARARPRDRRDVVGLAPRPHDPVGRAGRLRRRQRAGAASRGRLGGVVVSARITIGASSPLAPCTVMTRTSSRAISMSRLTSMSAARSQATKPCSDGASRS